MLHFLFHVHDLQLCYMFSLHIVRYRYTTMYVNYSRQFSNSPRHRTNVFRRLNANFTYWKQSKPPVQLVTSSESDDQHQRLHVVNVAHCRLRKVTNNFKITGKTKLTAPKIMFIYPICSYLRTTCFLTTVLYYCQ